MHIIKYKPYIELEMSKLTIYHFYYLKIYRKMSKCEMNKE